jgi:hypothetical protein
MSSKSAPTPLLKYIQRDLQDDDDDAEDLEARLSTI